MKNLWISLALTLTAIFLNISNPAIACTDFRLTAKDGTILITRSLEFAEDLKSNLRSSPRGRAFTTTTADGKPGLVWKSKYGYLFLDGLNVDIAMDGMNEEGLTFEALYLPVFAEYQTIPAGHNQQALPYISLGDWILGNFKTVDEVRAALPKIFVYNAKIPTVGDVTFPLHFAVYDSTGKGIVIEYVNGKLNIYDNQIGVMTNSPTYDWHLLNLRNYVHLAPVNPPPVIADGIKFAATGQGFGMIGLPGDISPPSRFVKIAVLKDVVIQADDAASAVNLAEHIINNVDIPLGLAREPDSGKFTSDTTSWVVFKDVTHKVFYYRTYGDLSLHAVSMSKIDFRDNAPRLKMPIASIEHVNDMTDQFLKATS